MTAGAAPASLRPGALAELARRPISAADKGFGCLAPVTAAELAARRPGLFGGAFTFPLMVLRHSALQANIDAMAAWCAAAGVALAPHGKTTMAPQIFARQLAAGAWGITAATIAHVQAYRVFGVSRILLANEVTDPAGIAWLGGELAADPGFECYVYADSMAAVRLLHCALRDGPTQRAGRRLAVLVELGQPGGRTGCREVRRAVNIARAVAAADTLRLAGAAGYEGTVGHDGAPGTLASVAAFCRDLRTLGAGLAALPGDGEPLILSAGGSSFFDVVAAELSAGPAGPAGPAGQAAGRPVVVLRSGAYVTHDHGLYAGLSPAGAGRPGPHLVPALEVWAPLLSRPEHALAVLCAGRRDAPFDQGMPVPLRVRHTDGTMTQARSMHITQLDDQHAYLHVAPGSTLTPGDLVCLGISHPCTAFDKWRVIPEVDDDYQVIDAIHTFF